MKDTQITIVIREDLVSTADALARRIGLTRSALWSEAIADFLDLHGAQDLKGEEPDEDESTT